MPYRRLPPVQATAAADTTGNNAGNLTTSFDISELLNLEGTAEIYRAVAQNVTAGATALVAVNKFPTSANIFGTLAEWDPSQPPLILPGDEIYFYWSIPEAGTPPIVTLWMRQEYV